MVEGPGTLGGGTYTGGLVHLGKTQQAVSDPVSIIVYVVLAPLLRGDAFNFLAVFPELSILDHFFLLHRLWTKTPPPWVGITFHDTTLNLRHNTVITGGKFNGRHLRDSECNGLAWCSC